MGARVEGGSGIWPYSDGEHPQPDPDGFQVGEEEEHIARKVGVSDGGGNMWPAVGLRILFPNVCLLFYSYSQNFHPLFFQIFKYFIYYSYLLFFTCFRLFSKLTTQSTLLCYTCTQYQKSMTC